MLWVDDWGRRGVSCYRLVRPRCDVIQDHPHMQLRREAQA